MHSCFLHIKGQVQGRLFFPAQIYVEHFLQPLEPCTRHNDCPQYRTQVAVAQRHSTSTSITFSNINITSRCVHRAKRMNQVTYLCYNFGSNHSAIVKI